MRRSLMFIAVFAVAFALGAMGYRYYVLLPHNHFLKAAWRSSKASMGIQEAHPDNVRFSMLQTWHVETANALSFVDPEQGLWLATFNRNNWNKADNVNAIYVFTHAAGPRGLPRVRLSSDCHPMLKLADFRPFNAIYRNLQIVADFGDKGVPPLVTLQTFDKTGFHPSLKPEVKGNRLIVTMPTHPIIIDDTDLDPYRPESLNQRGQIAHLHIVLALEVYAHGHGVDISDVLSKDVIVAHDNNSYRNHQFINTVANALQARLPRPTAQRQALALR